jgi:carotenoid 1,2-hydratase
VFSPDYAQRMRRGEPVRAEEHVAVNLALYERGRQICWVMSEYGAPALSAQPSELRVHRSRIAAAGDRLRVEVDDRTAPFFASLAGVGSAVRGCFEVEPLEAPLPEVKLAAADGHTHAWRVPAPRARFRVTMERPAFRFEGTGYHDINRGDGRLEHAFSRWSWARFHAPDRTLILYSTVERTGSRRALVVDGGQAHTLDAADGAPHRAGWGLAMPEWFSLGESFHCEPRRLIEVAPFYSRYLGVLTESGRPIADGMGEYLDLDRFRARGIQFLLRFKTRRVS